MTSLANRKASLRKRMSVVRDQAHAEAGGAGAALLRYLPDIASDAIVSGYTAIRSEIDPRRLMDALHGRGHRLCLPVIEARGRPLRFREWAPGVRMTTGPFGVAVPDEGAWLEPQVLLVPLLAFDRRGFRLGYGGGFYDRTLQRLRGHGPVLAVGLAYAAQEVDRVPTDATDQRLDAILTGTGLIRPQLHEVP